MVESFVGCREALFERGLFELVSLVVEELLDAEWVKRDEDDEDDGQEGVQVGLLN